MKAVGDFGLLTRNISLEIMNGKPIAFTNAVPELGQKSHAIAMAIRKELEIPIKN